MTRGEAFLLALTASALVMATATVSAGAPAVAPVIRIDCPVFSEEEAASLEARARTDLLVRQRMGTVLVFCRPPVLQVTWHEASGPSARLDGPIAADARLTIERALNLLDELLTQPPDDAGVIEARPTGPGSAPPAPDQPNGAASGVRLGAEGSIELWSTEVIGAAGPALRAIVTLPRGLAVTARGEVLWTLRPAPRDVRGRMIGAGLGAQYHFDSLPGRVELMVGLGSLRAQRSGAETQAADKLVPSILLGGQYAFGTSDFRVLTGPALSIYPSSPEAQIGGVEVFRLPPITGRWLLGVELGPL